MPNMGSEQPMASLKELIEACHFERCDSRFTDEYFPIQYPIAPLSLITILVLNDQDAMTSWIERAIKNNGYRSATLAELLVRCAADPKLHEAGPVAALGTSWNYWGTRVIPDLGRYNKGRGLFLHPTGPNDIWAGYYRFLIVPI